MQRVISIVVSFLFGIAAGFAQLTNDSVFTLDSFIAQVKRYHPVAKQADLVIDKANVNLLSAKGGFDPLIRLNAGNKTFDGKSYYYYNNPEMVIPLPIGQLKAGLENSGGDYLNSETTRGKTSYAGVDIPLLNGLLLDKRRAALQQAEIYRGQSTQERLMIRNRLLFDAYMAYWSWAAEFQQYKMYSDFLDNANKRLRLVRNGFINGDYSPMDTTEAFIQLQNYQLMQTDALLNWKNAGIELSNYLWRQDETAYFLQEDQYPEELETKAQKHLPDADYLITLSANQNPSLLIYDYKLQVLEVEKRLQRQSLLPYLGVKANILNRGYFLLKGLDAGKLENNYLLGVDIKIPLLFREARGQFQKTGIDIKNMKLDFLNKRQQTENSIRVSLNQYATVNLQLENISIILANYVRLLRNEELKLFQGESSLFLVNNREIKVIETLQKQIDLAFKAYKLKYTNEWMSGTIDF